jgi:hypothetical protein
LSWTLWEFWIGEFEDGSDRASERNARRPHTRMVDTSQ